ncbi:MAG TPA: AAA family ATPase [Pseudonocardiaceae bacterium]|nr:AAA family ATPase [Pseudonocardiaceae bacterium]
MPDSGRLGVPSNLPGELSSFVGREADLDRGAALVAATRLLTLTGAGGCGKTRLARRLAARAAGGFPDGVWWVELAALTDPAMIADAVARAVGLALPAEVSAAEALANHLADACCLLVLDNCEHLVDGVAEVADGLLRATPAVRILATSREPLRVEGETTWRVPSLQTPTRTVDADAVTGFDAVRLFVERAAAARAGFDPAGAYPDVARICRTLDGIPLALELAAARTRTLSVGQIVTELDDRFALLTGGARPALPRHRTLLASVTWSYDLLAPIERVLLCRLGVFVGGFDTASATAVAGGDPLAPADVRDVVARLVEKSLVQVEDASGATTRYRLLETIRAFAVDRLAEVGEYADVADRHLHWAMTLAEAREEGTTRADGPALDQLELELPNLRVALDHASVTAPPEHTGLRLIAALALFWAQRGHALEGGERAAGVLAADPAAPLALRARARWAGAYARFYAFDLEASAAEAATALAEARDAGDLGTQGRSLHVLAAGTVMVDPAAARPMFGSALELARAAGDQWCAADSLQFIGWSHLIQHRPTALGSELAESGAMADATGNLFQQGWHLIGLGNLHTAAGELDAAVRALRAAIDISRRVGDPAVELWASASEVVVELGRDRLAEVRRIAAEINRPARQLAPVDEQFVAALRVIVDRDSAPEPAAAALVSAGELLLPGNDPPDGARLVLMGANVALAAGNIAAAEAAGDRALAACVGLGSALAGACRVLLGRIERRRRSPGAADRLVHEGLGELVDAGLWFDVPDALEVLGGLAVDAGRAAEGIRLLAAAEAVDSRTGRRSRSVVTLPGPPRRSTPTASGPKAAPSTPRPRSPTPAVPVASAGDRPSAGTVSRRPSTRSPSWSRRG